MPQRPGFDFYSGTAVKDSPYTCGFYIVYTKTPVKHTFVAFATTEI